VQGVLANLLSQLEESKFLRLFHQFSPAPDPEGWEAEDFSSISVPLDLEDAEVHLRPIEGPAPRARAPNRLTASWFFQLAYSPVVLREEAAVEEFIAQNLKRAFINIRKHPDVLDVLTQRSPKRLLDIPEDPYRDLMNRRSPKRLLERLGVPDGRVAHWDGYEPLNVQYWVYTNVLFDRDRAYEPWTRFCDNARQVFEEICGTNGGEVPEFDIATPYALERWASEDIERFLVDLLNTPSNFYLVAREGHISVIPNTEHGAFLATASGLPDDRSDGLSTVISSSLTADRVPSIIALKDFEALLNDRTADERDLQAFFEENPQFLFALDERYCEVRAHVSLLDRRDNRLIPDFMARIQDSNVWNVIELKRPRDCVQSHRGGRSKVSAAAARAVAEALRYREAFSTRDNRRRMAERYGISAYEPCLTVVIGRGRSRQRLEWDSVRAGLPSVEIVSYDYLFERARCCRAELDAARKDKG
jgi:hypothetical protein